jgi:hypothetical protein
MRIHDWSKRAVVVGVLSVAALASAKLPYPTSDDDRTGKRELHMANCPSAVEGSTTNVVDLDDGIELTITAREEWAKQEIRRRAQNQGESAWKPERGALEHTGMGTGSGRYGFCPGILEATTVDAELLPDGAKLTVRADRPAQVERLKRVTRDRLEWMRKRRIPRS